MNPGDYEFSPVRLQRIVARGPLRRATENADAIDLIKQLQRERRYATEYEQEQLAAFVGFGDSQVLQYLFDPRPKWSASQRHIHERLKALTTDAERESLRDSIPNAHYTYGIYTPIWRALSDHGFPGGRVLEPAVGTGMAFGTMPATMRQNSTLAAVEKEQFTAAIAAALYPSASVQASPYQNADVDPRSQDLIISNVPFADVRPFDKRLPAAGAKLKPTLHNYFFVKALEHVRPGGLVVFITTRETMDAATTGPVRQYLMDRADFLGAVRLPVQAHMAGARTEVITDIVVLRAREPGEEARINEREFVDNDRISLDGPEGLREFSRSAWYTTHPELVLGTEAASGTMRAPGQYNVEGALDYDKLYDALGTVLRPNEYRHTVVEDDAGGPVKLARGDRAPRAFEIREHDGKLYQQQPTGLAEEYLPTKTIKGEQVPDKTRIARIKAQLPVREALLDLVSASADPDTNDVELKDLRTALQTAYDTFHTKYGRLNDSANSRAFQDDLYSPNLLGLEVMKNKAVAQKRKDGKRQLRMVQEFVGLSDIFTTRTIQAQTEVTSVETPRDALWASLSSHATIDWGFMSKLTSTPAGMLQSALLDTIDVFQAPDGSWQPRQAYLSGYDVVGKLEAARAAKERGATQFDRNIEELEKIQPVPIEPHQITFTLGQHWIDPQYIKDFIANQLDGQTVPVKFVDMEMKTFWSVDIPEWMPPALHRAVTSWDLAVAYGPEGSRKTYGFFDMLSDALNFKQPEMKWQVKVGNETITEKDPQATIAARENIQQLKDRWIDWIANDDGRLNDLTSTYNERYNRSVLRDWEPGPLQESLRRGGLALPFDYHSHQLRGIWRGLVGGNELLAHHVGAGKTFEAISIAMMWRQTGRARKPMITVPPDTLSGWRRDIGRAYPAARVLVFDTADLKRDRRQQSMARIAYGDWDMVVVPHSSFELMGVSKERMAAVIQRWLDVIYEIARSIADTEKEAQKQIQRMVAQLEKRMADVENRTDENITWEELGVDALIVDEAHKFKNLFYFTKMENVRGLSKAESRRSLDLFVKVQRINETSNFRNLVFLTATPIMNSPAEIFHMQRFLQPHALEAMGLEDFDSWAAMFIQPKPARVQKPDGSYKEIVRLKHYNNLFTLHQQLMHVADYVGPDDMPYLKRPEIEGGQIETIQLPKPPVYDPLLHPWFVRRTQALEDHPPAMRDGVYDAPDRPHPITGEKTHRFDNHLTVMGDARLAAIDPRLILGLEHLDDYPDSRVNRTADIVAAFYARTTKETPKNPALAAAMIFLDVGTPKNPPPLAFLEGAEVDAPRGEETAADADADADAEAAEDGMSTSAVDLYELTKQELVKRGIPEKEIAYVHQANKVVERQALFDAVNSGKVRVLFGSTQRGGEGVNVQERLGLMVHMDVPKTMRPGDMIQRNGRIVRQGNLFDAVRVVRFVTKGTTDEWLYGELLAKEHFIEGFWRGEVNSFEENDVGTGDNFQEAQRLATGDPRALRLMDLKDEATKLKAKSQNEDRQRMRRAQERSQAERSIARQKKLVEHTEKFVNEHYTEKLVGDAFVLTIDGTPYTGVGAANKAILAAATALLEDPSPGGRVALPMQLGSIPFAVQLEKALDKVMAELGEAKPVYYVRGEITYMDGNDVKRLGRFDTLDDEKVRPAASIQHWYNHLPDHLERERDYLEREQEELAQLAGTGTSTDTKRKLIKVESDIDALERVFLEETRQRDQAAREAPPAPADDDVDEPSLIAGGDFDPYESERPATADERPWVEFDPVEWSFDSYFVQVHVDGERLEGGIRQEPDEFDGEVEERPWVVDPELDIGPASGESFATLDEAKEAVAASIGDVPPRKVEPVDFSAPFRWRDGARHVRVFVDGDPLDAMLEADEDTGEWIVDAPAEVADADPSPFGLESGDTRRFPALEDAQAWAREQLTAARGAAEAAMMAARARVEEQDDSDDVDEASFRYEPPTTAAGRAGEIGIPPNPAETAQIDGEQVAPLEVPELVELAKELGADVKVRGMPDADGKFRGPGGILLHPSLFKANRWRELAAVLGHEIGHLVDWLPDRSMKRGNLIGRVATLRNFLQHTFEDEHGTITLGALRRELEQVSLEWRPWKPKLASSNEKKYRQSSKELFADAISALLVNPAFLERTAPTFWQAFFDRLDSKPAVKDAYFALQALMAGERGVILDRRDEKIREGFRKADAKAIEADRARRAARARARWHPDAWISAWFDKLYPLKRRVQQAGEQDPWKDPAKDLLALNRQNLGPWWDQHVHPILEQIREADLSIEDIGTVLAYRRIADGDRSEYLNPGGLSGISSGSIVNRILAAYREKAPKNDDEYRVDPHTLDDIVRLRRIAEGDRPDEDLSPEEAREQLDEAFGGIKAGHREVIREATDAVFEDIGKSRIESARELLKHAQEGLNDNQRKVMDAAVKRFYNLIDSVQAEAFDAQLYDERLFDLMQRSENWVSFRVVDYIAETMTHHVRHQIGTAKDVANPFLTTLRKLAVTKRAIAVNRAKLKSLGWLRRHFSGDIRAADTFKIMLAGGRVGRRPKKPPRGDGMVIVYEKGRAHGYWMEQTLANGINDARAAELELIEPILSFANNYIFRPAHITLSIPFMMFNPVRDMRRLQRNNPAMKWRTLPHDMNLARKAITGAIVRGTDSAIARRMFPKAAQLVRLAEEEGIFGPLRRSDYLLGRADDHQLIENLVERGMENAKLDTPSRWRTTLRRTGVLPVLNAVAQFGDVIEAWSKVTGLLSEMEQAGGAVEDIDPDARYRVVDRYGTPDWTAGGTRARQINGLFLYSNVYLRGMQGDYQAATDPKTAAGWWFKMATGSLALKALSTLTAAGLLFGGGGDDEEEDAGPGAVLRRMSDYDRWFYDLLPLWVDDQGRGIALRVPPDYTGRLMGAVFAIALEESLKDPDKRDSAQALADAFKSVLGDSPTLTPMLGIPIATGQYLSGDNPYDHFRGRPLFTEDELAAAGPRKHKKFLRYVLSEMGAGTYVSFDLNGDRPQPPAANAFETMRRQVVIGPILNRAIRVTDYGLHQRAQEAKGRDERLQAQRRQRQSDAFDAAARRYLSQATGRGDADRRLRSTIAYDVARELADQERGDAPRREYRSYLRQMERRALVDLSFNADERTILRAVGGYGTSTDQAVAAVQEIVDQGVSRSKVERFLEEFEASDIISEERLFTVLDALEEAR